MKKFFLILISLSISFSLFANSQAELVDTKPTTLEEKFSYAYGYLMMGSMAQNFPDIDLNYLLTGANDFLQNNTDCTLDEMYSWLNEYQEKMMEEQAKIEAEIAEQNLADAETFLKENRKNVGVEETASGLQYKIISLGTGKYPKMGDVIECNYSLMLADGSVIDSSDSHGGSATFYLDNLVDGFAEGMTIIPEGTRIRLWVHPDLGYEDQTKGNIPPNSLLIFDVELLSIK